MVDKKLVAEKIDKLISCITNKLEFSASDSITIENPSIDSIINACKKLGWRDITRERDKQEQLSFKDIKDSSSKITICLLAAEPRSISNGNSHYSQITCGVYSEKDSKPEDFVVMEGEVRDELGKFIDGEPTINGIDMDGVKSVTVTKSRIKWDPKSGYEYRYGGIVKVR